MRSLSLLALLLLPLSTFALPLDLSPQNSAAKVDANALTNSLPPTVEHPNHNSSPLPRGFPKYDGAAESSSELSNVNRKPLSHGYDRYGNYEGPKKQLPPVGFVKEYYSGKENSRPPKDGYPKIGKSPLGN